MESANSSKVGTGKSATLNPGIPASQFVTIDQNGQRSNQSRSYGHATRPFSSGEEFGDGGLNDEELEAVAPDDFVDIDRLAPANPKRQKPNSNFAKQKTTDVERENNATGETRQLSNGNWACLHKCSGFGTCKHKCCREGTKHRPHTKRRASKRDRRGLSNPEPAPGRDAASLENFFSTSRFENSRVSGGRTVRSFTTSTTSSMNENSGGRSGPASTSTYHGPVLPFSDPEQNEHPLATNTDNNPMDEYHFAARGSQIQYPLPSIGSGVERQVSSSTNSQALMPAVQSQQAPQAYVCMADLERMDVDPIRFPNETSTLTSTGHNASLQIFDPYEQQIAAMTNQTASTQDFSGTFEFGEGQWDDFALFQAANDDFSPAATPRALIATGAAGAVGLEVRDADPNGQGWEDTVLPPGQNWQDFSHGPAERRMRNIDLTAVQHRSRLLNIALGQAPPVGYQQPTVADAATVPNLIQLESGLGSNMNSLLPASMSGIPAGAFLGPEYGEQGYGTVNNAVADDTVNDPPAGYETLDQWIVDQLGGDYVDFI